MRKCKGCNRELEEKSFILKGQGKRGYICYRCKYQRRSHNYKLKSNGRRSGYDISVEQYESIMEKQNKSCAICKEKTKLIVDHNHSTGNIRGFLCNNCNIALGMLKDSPENIRAALQYVIDNI